MGLACGWLSSGCENDSSILTTRLPLHGSPLTVFTLITLTWAFEALLGYPRGLFDKIGHPVSWMGRLVEILDHRWNLPNDSSTLQKRKGATTVIVIVGASVLVAIAITAALPDTFAGLCLQALLASSLLASRSLFAHVLAVSRPLEAGHLGGARSALGMIVGRDTAALDEPAMARASLESLAENASDGVIAPLFWGVMFGLPGMVAYKAINTLDSMIGHRSKRYLHFGWFAARLDDVANWLPARLSGCLFCLASARLASFSVMHRDARRHRSPNAGWPESALAGGLGIRLSGPRRYADSVSDEPWLNAEARDPVAADVRRGLWLYGRAMVLSAILLMTLAAWAH